MEKLTQEQKKQLERDIESHLYKQGKITTNELAKKYGLTWKRAKDAINAAKLRIEKQPLLEQTITPEETDLATNGKPTLGVLSDEERDVFRPRADAKPAESLIKPPTPPPNANKNGVQPLDGNLFYCGTCIKAGTQTVLDRNMLVCPNCRGALRWEN